jgi:outer membrane protein assembly factor BamB
VLLGIVASLALAGCWLVPGQNADRTAYNPFESTISPANVGGLAEAWSYQPMAGFAAGSPVVSPAGVHAVFGRCLLATVDRATGAQRWVASTFQSPEICAQQGNLIVYASPPFVDGDTITTGTFWWLHGAPSPQFGWYSTDFDATTGQADQRPSGVIAGRRDADVLAVAPYLATFNGIPFGPYGPFAFAGFGPVGGTERSIAIASTTTGGIGENPPLPTLGRDLLFHGSLGVLATTPGDPAVGMSVRGYSRTESRPGCGPSTRLVDCPVWSTPVNGDVTTSPVLAPDQSTVYVGTATGDVYALNAADGAVRWTAALGSAVRDEPALAEGVLYVPLADGRLVALEADGCGAATCDPLWTGPTGSSIDLQPAVAGGVVFTGSADGTVHAFDAAGCGAATCPALWSEATGSRITGAPAVSGGTLYIGTADGRLIAYR